VRTIKHTRAHTHTSTGFYQVARKETNRSTIAERPRFRVS